MGAIQLPRLINGNTNMQAASPAFESARLFSILGVGVDILMGFAYVLIIISALSIFIALYNSLKERRYTSRGRYSYADRVHYRSDHGTYGC
jgi:putative ABC transport system permease protein